MGKTKFVQGPDGQMNGSIGSGKSDIPCMAETVTRGTGLVTTAAPANYADIHAQYARLTPGHDWVLQQSPSKQQEIVTDPTVSAALLYALATDRRTEPEILARIVTNPAATPETVQAISRSERSTMARCWAAWSDKLPAEELPRLARDRNVNIRQGICEHRDAPSGLLLQMGSRAAESDRYVRQSARDHRNYPKKAERLALVQAPGTDPATLRVLTGDGLKQISNIARDRLAALGADLPALAGDDDD